MYYLGATTDLVKPIRRRLTFTRGQRPQMSRRYLQKTGRKPVNRRGYPTMGTPIAVDLSMKPGWGTLGERMLVDGFDREVLGGINDAITLSVQPRGRRVRVTRPYDPYSSVELGNPNTRITVSRYGRRLTTNPYDPFAAVEVGDVATDWISQVLPSQGAPSVPSVITAPTSVPGSGFVSSIFDSASNFMKNISVSVDPLRTIQAVQQIIKPSQVGFLANQLNRFGINPAYMGLPVTGTTAQYGYRAAGIDWMSMLPWIAGGAALLFVVPMVMGKK